MCLCVCRVLPYTQVTGRHSVDSITNSAALLIRFSVLPAFNCRYPSPAAFVAAQVTRLACSSLGLRQKPVSSPVT